MSFVRGVHALVAPDDGAEDWFDATETLGRRGTRLLPRGAQLTAACAKLLPPSAGLGAVAEGRRGIWVATSTVAEDLHEEMDEVIRSEGAMALSAIQAPYFSINLIANRLSKDTDSRGMAMTVTTPHTGLADAMAAASVALDNDAVDGALVACTEVSSQSPIDDGCVVFALDQSDNALRRLSVLRGFIPDNASAALLSRRAWRLAGELDEPPGPHVIFTDRPRSDIFLHAIIDFSGECIDASVRSLTKSMLPQALALADLCSSDSGGSLTICSAMGQWAHIRVSPVREYSS